MSEPMPAERLAEIREREQAATEGPWVPWDTGVGYHIGVGALGEGGRPARLLPEGMRTDIGLTEDAAFIAHSRQDVGDLLAEVYRLRADNQRLRTGIDSAISHIGENAVWTQPLLAMLAAQGGAE